MPCWASWHQGWAAHTGICKENTTCLCNTNLFSFIYSYIWFTSMMFSWSYSVFFTLNGQTESKTHIYQHLLIAKFEKLKIVQMRLLWVSVCVAQTSVPRKVGRMYKLAESEWGTQSWSTSTNFLMHSSNSARSKLYRKAETDVFVSVSRLNTECGCSKEVRNVSLTGRQALWADFSIRFMFIMGLKRRTLLSSPQYAFIPSKSCTQYVFTFKHK